MVKKKNTSKKVALIKEQKPTFNFVFGKKNYTFMLIGLAVIVLGFILMYGGTENIYEARRITIAPIVVIAGFAIEVFAIFAKSDVDESH